jgi:UDP-N-acetylmuramoyl-L-alanyl-D-glutamate--2,6-diaminopimelate ligase
MRLSALANIAVSGADPEIAGLTADSRAVKPGFLFAAMPGAKADGAAFVAMIAKGGRVLRRGVACAPRPYLHHDAIRAGV